MNIRFNNIAVRSIAVALGENEFDLTELSDIYEKDEINRIIKTNGISKIRIASENTCTSDLCEKAARHIFDAYDSKQIGGIVFVSQTPDYILPSTGASLQHRLGISKNAVTFDINQGCSGYIYGLYQASLLVASGSCDSVLVCAGDVLTRCINPLDKSNRMVFGDAGSATIVEKNEKGEKNEKNENSEKNETNENQIAFSIMTDGSGTEHLIIPAGGCRYPKDENSETVSVRNDGNMRSDEDLFMNGLEIMNFSLREVPKTVDSVLSCKGWDKSEITLFGFHQANKFMLDYLAKVMKLPKESVPIAMGNTGNTSAASIPTMLTLEYKRLSEQHRLQKTVLCGFGVGLSCAASALDLSMTKFSEPL